MKNKESLNQEFNTELMPKMMGYVYNKPPISLLADYPPYSNQAENYDDVKAKIEDAMHEFRVDGKVLTATRGPTFTLYEVQLATGVDVAKVHTQRNNLKMRLAFNHLRIVSPLPGKNAIGLEISNVKRDTVGFKDLLLSPEFNQDEPGIMVGFGRDINGKIHCDNLAKLPHLLVAGKTGSGKSVFIHNIVMSIIYKYSPEDVRLMMIDPKWVEFSVFEGMPHMLVPEAAKEPKEAINMLNWLAAEVQRRYEFLKSHGCNEISIYNDKIRDKEKDPKMFSIVMIVDEVAELMLESKSEVEDAIESIAQLGRACGVHLVLATQRPAVNVISGIIKSNITCRVGLKVATGSESTIILNQTGAEALLGNGDMLYVKDDAQAERIQSAYVGLTSEIIPIVRYLKENNKCVFNESAQRAIFDKEDLARAQEQQRQEAKTENINITYSTEDDETIKPTMHFLKSGNVYNKPPMDLLAEGEKIDTFPADYAEYKQKLENALQEYRAPCKVVGATQCSAYTVYELQPDEGVSYHKIKSAIVNIQMRLGVRGMRFIGNILGKNTIGAEICNEKRMHVNLKDIMQCEEYKDSNSGLSICLGVDSSNKPICKDLTRMPQILMSGCCGSGKSILQQDIILSLICKYSPQDVRLVLVDPRGVDLSIFDGIPHGLFSRSARSLEEGVAVFKWLYKESMDRMEFLRKKGCSTIDAYNDSINTEEEAKMYRIVVVVDELSELLYERIGKEVENYICRIAQIGKACGIHMVLSIQKVSVLQNFRRLCDYIPTHIAFKLFKIDSHIMLGSSDAESLLGDGDMLLLDSMGNLERIQAAFSGTLREVMSVVSYIKENNDCVFDDVLQKELLPESEAKKQAIKPTADKSEDAHGNSSPCIGDNKDLKPTDEEDLKRIMKVFLKQQKVSASLVQAKLGMGYIKARRLIEEACHRGYVSEILESEGDRQLLMTAEEFEVEFGESLNSHKDSGQEQE